MSKDHKEPVKFKPRHADLVLVPLALLCYLSSRGTDGTPTLFIAGLIPLTLIYCWIQVSVTRRAFTWQSLAHLFLFPLVCLFATGFQSRLQELSGIWIMMYPAAVGIMVILGAICILVAKAVRRGSENPVLCRTCEYNLYGNTSGICPECGTSAETVR